MTYQPVVPFGGIGGWSFLSRTREAQQDAFNGSGSVTRDTAYFEEKISQIRTAEDLVSDRRLMRVALGAFGLDEDINNKFFIRKALEETTFDRKSLVNRLSDKRYLEMSKQFGFGDLSPPNTVLSDFGQKITALYKERQFEIAVGEQSQDMRLALGLERDLGTLAARDISDEAAWFTIMATQPLRVVFERALSLPTIIGTLDLDRQLQLFRDKAEAVFGDSRVSQFSDPVRLDDLRRSFLAQSELQAGAFSTSARGSAALALLQQSSIGGAGAILGLTRQF